GRPGAQPAPRGAAAHPAGAEPLLPLEPALPEPAVSPRRGRAGRLRSGAGRRPARGRGSRAERGAPDRSRRRAPPQDRGPRDLVAAATVREPRVRAIPSAGGTGARRVRDVLRARRAARVRLAPLAPGAPAPRVAR